MSNSITHTPKGKCIIVSAPSGAGKTTLVKHLLEGKFNLAFSVSAASRPKRNGETHGKDYYFISAAEFREKIQNNEFIEWEEVYPGSFYGTLKSEIQRIWNNHQHVIFDVDVYGGVRLKKIFGEQALALFIMPPDLNTLEKRLRTRASDSEESLLKRIEKACHEMEFKDQFDQIIINDNLEDAIIRIESIVSSFLNMSSET